MEDTKTHRLWMKLQHKLRLDELSPGMRQVVICVVGGGILLLGIIMIVLPGPAFIMIPLGLAVLSTEFVWARRCLDKVRNILRNAKTSLFSKTAR